MIQSEFFTYLSEICTKIGIEDHDCGLLHEFGESISPQDIPTQVQHLNALLWSSYLVYDPFQQDFRLYKRTGP